MTKAEASCFGLITRRQGSPENATMLGKRKAAGKEEGHVRGGPTPYGCHRRESAGADGALWVSLARSRSCLSGIHAHTRTHTGKAHALCEVLLGIPARDAGESAPLFLASLRRGPFPVSRPAGCAVVSHYGFNLLFLEATDVEHFPCVYWSHLCL